MDATYINSGSFQAGFTTGFNAILKAMQDGRIIEAIKLHRQYSGASLKEAKDAIEAMYQTQREPYGQSGKYRVLVKTQDFESNWANEWSVIGYDDDTKEDAIRTAEGYTGTNVVDVLVVKIVGRSEVKRTIVEV